MSIRMTRREHTDSLPIPRRTVTKKMFADLMTRRMKQSLLKQGVIKHTPKKTWNYSVDGGPVAVVYAHTRSEARAEIKTVLGINKGRLPVGVTIYEAMPERSGAA